MAESFANLTTASAPLDVQRLLAIVREFEANFPKSEQCVRVKMSQDTLDTFKESQVDMPPTEVSAIHGIPIVIENYLPLGAFAQEMSDGSSLLTYRGRTMKLPSLADLWK